MAHNRLGSPPRGLDKREREREANPGFQFRETCFEAKTHPPGKQPPPWKMMTGPGWVACGGSGDQFWCAFPARQRPFPLPSPPTSPQSLPGVPGRPASPWGPGRTPPQSGLAGSPGTTETGGGRPHKAGQPMARDPGNRRHLARGQAPPTLVFRFRRMKILWTLEGRRSWNHKTTFNF